MTMVLAAAALSGACSLETGLQTLSSDPLLGEYVLDSLEGSRLPLALADAPQPGCATTLDSGRLTIGPRTPTGAPGFGYFALIVATSSCPPAVPLPVFSSAIGQLVRTGAVLTFHRGYEAGSIFATGVATLSGVRLDSAHLDFLGTRRGLAFRQTFGATGLSRR